MREPEDITRRFAKVFIEMVFVVNISLEDDEEVRRV